MKARYFPDGNILNVVQKKKAYYAWKSLLHGQDLVKLGMRVLVGNGTNQIINSPTTTFEEKMTECFRCTTTTNLSHLHDLPIWILWRIWKNRNVLIFQRKHVSWRTYLQQARKDAKEWIDSSAQGLLTTF